MRIAISGAQSTGKSTVIDELQKDKYIAENYTLIKEVTRNVRKKGLKINDDSDNYNLVQIMIMSGHIENSLLDNTIIDRCALDGYVYTQYLYEQGKVDEWVLDFAEEVFNMLKDKYDIIFYISPEFDIYSDGVRSTDTKFRDAIVDIFWDTIVRYDIKTIKLIGTIEDRAIKFKNVVKGYSKKWSHTYG